MPRPILALGLLCLALGAPSPALANPECASESPDAVCTIRTVGGLVFETARRNLVPTRDAGDVRVRGEITLLMGVADLMLEEADVLFTPLPGGELWIQHGAARAPYRTLPFFSDLPVQPTPPFVAFGLADTEELEALFEDLKDPDTWLPLAENEDPEHPGELLDPVYVFFHAQTGSDMAIPIPGFPPGENAPTLTLTSAQSLTIIVEPSDPYVYYSNAGGKNLFKKLQKAAQKQAEKRRANEKRKRSAQEEAKRRQKKEAAAAKVAKKQTADRKKAARDEKQGKKKKKKKKKKSKKGLPKATFAFSWKGGIPYAANRAELGGVVADASGLSFHGHLYVKLPVPMGALMAMEGPTVLRLDRGTQMGGNGLVEVSLPFVGDVLGLSIPLGSASAGLLANTREQGGYFAGTLDPDLATFTDIVPIAPTGSLQVTGRVSSSDLASSFLEAKGDFGIDTATLGELTGVKLGRVLSVDGLLRLDREGFRLRGTTTARLHKAIAFEGRQEVEAFFAGANPVGSFVRIRGSMAVGRVDLGTGASLSLSPAGAFVSGRFATGAAGIALSGQITAAGPVLEGATHVSISLDDLNDGIRDARAKVAAAQAEVDRIDLAIPAMRQQVLDERRANSKAFQDARRGLDIARAEVNRIDAVIADLDDDIASYKKSLDACGRFDVICKGRWGGKITAATASKLAQQGLLETAKLALTKARDVLDLVEKGLLAVPVDADPRIVALFAARETATLALTAAQAALVEVPVGGALDARITLRLDARGIGGTATALVNGTPVADGTVTFGARPEACFDLTLGRVCAPI